MEILLTMPHPNPKRRLFDRFNYPSLTLKQLAAITPPGHKLELVDERYEPIGFNKNYDVVCISCLTYNSLRGYEVAAEFRKRGIPAIIGGYHATLMPEEAKQHADAVVIGGGILGASTAHFLAKTGFGKVILLEKKVLGPH